MIVAAILVLLAASQVHAPAPTAQSPEAFVRALYAREGHPTSADEEAFAGYKGAEQIYSPSLLALIRKDRHDTPKGDIPKLEGDPLCDCQDSPGLSITDVHTTLTTPDQVDVQLTLNLRGEKPRTITLHLLHVPAGWRIDDIATKDIPSLRKYLSEGDASATSAETPQHFMRRVLQLASDVFRNGALYRSERIYSPTFLDAEYGVGCFTTHRGCVIDQLEWIKICGCHYVPTETPKKKEITCGCAGALSFSDLSLVRANTKSADVSALLNLEPHHKDKLTWHLIMTSTGWRIDDVATADVPSLKARLQSRQVN